jgi:hypothetical protein
MLASKLSSSPCDEALSPACRLIGARPGPNSRERAPAAFPTSRKPFEPLARWVRASAQRCQPVTAAEPARARWKNCRGERPRPAHLIGAPSRPTSERAPRRVP